MGDNQQRIVRAAARDAFLRFSDGGLISGAAVLEFVEGSTYAEACHQHEFEHAWAEADRHQRGALDEREFQSFLLAVDRFAAAAAAPEPAPAPAAAPTPAPDKEKRQREAAAEAERLAAEAKAAEEKRQREAAEAERRRAAAAAAEEKRQREAIAEAERRTAAEAEEKRQREAAPAPAPPAPLSLFDVPAAFARNACAFLGHTPVSPSWAHKALATASGVAIVESSVLSASSTSSTSSRATISPCCRANTKHMFCSSGCRLSQKAYIWSSHLNASQRSSLRIRSCIVYCAWCAVKTHSLHRRPYSPSSFLSTFISA